MLAMSRFVLRHKGAVVVFWLAVLVAGVVVLIWQHGHGSHAIWACPRPGRSPTGYP